MGTTPCRPFSLVQGHLEETKMEDFYKIHNTVREIRTRSIRQAAPQHARMKQYVGELRVLRGRPLTVTGATLEKHLEELKAKSAQGLVEVQTMDGRLVNLSDMSASATPAQSPAPRPPLDSANNDKNQSVGENIPQFPGGVPLGSVGSAGGEGSIPGPLGSESAEDESSPDLGDPAGEELTEAQGTDAKKKKGKR